MVGWEKQPTSLCLPDYTTKYTIGTELIWTHRIINIKESCQKSKHILGPIFMSRVVFNCFEVLRITSVMSSSVSFQLQSNKFCVHTNSVFVTVWFKQDGGCVTCVTRFSNETFLTFKNVVYSKFVFF